MDLAEHMAKKQKLERPQVKHYYPLLTLIKLYIFADMRQCPQLKCSVMDAICDCCIQNSPEWSELGYIWDHTPEGCGLQRFMLDLLTRNAVTDQYWTSDAIASGIKNCKNADLMSEVVLRLYKARANLLQPMTLSNSDLSVQKPCAYHDHDGDDEQMKRATVDEIIGTSDT